MEAQNTPATPVQAPVASEAPAAPAAAAPAAPKKKKTGLIIGIVVTILVLCGAGAAAAYFLFFNKNNPEQMFADNISDILSGKIENIKINGQFKFPTSELSATIYGEASAKSKAGKVGARMTATGMNMGADLIFKDNDAYVKTEGLSQGIALFALIPGAGTSGLSNMSALSTIMNQIDGNWYHLDSSSAASSFVTVSSTSSTCAEVFQNDGNLSKLGELFKANPFVTLKSGDNNIAKKKGEVYRVNFDSSKFTALINAIKADATLGKYSSCFDSASINQTSATMPLYIEFSDGKISRLYLDLATAGAVDIDIEYPASLDINAPASYKEFSSVFGNLTGPSSSKGFDLSSIIDSSYGSDYDFDFDDDDYDFDFDYDYDDDDEDYDFDFDLSDLLDL